MPDVIYAGKAKAGLDFWLDHPNMYAKDKYYSQSKVDELLERQRASCAYKYVDMANPLFCSDEIYSAIRNAKIGDSDDT